ASRPSLACRTLSELLAARSVQWNFCSKRAASWRSIGLSSTIKIVVMKSLRAWASAERLLRSLFVGECAQCRQQAVQFLLQIASCGVRTCEVLNAARVFQAQCQFGRPLSAQQLERVLQRMGHDMQAGGVVPPQRRVELAEPFWTFLQKRAGKFAQQV